VRERWVSPNGRAEKFIDAAGRWQDSTGYTTAPPRSGKRSWRRISQMEDNILNFGGYPVG
jgi:hypothetical protein